MDIWIIRDGRKSGPYPDDEIRRKIEDGVLNATSPVWHEGLDEWKPASSLALFKSSFEPKPVVPPPPPVEVVRPKPAASPTSSDTAMAVPASPSKTVLIRRFLARWFDLLLYAGLWWLTMWAAGRDINAALLSPWLMILKFVPWFAFEAVLIHRYGTTPGKWLMGLRVENQNGTLLNLGEATRRSFRVMIMGVGFGWEIIAVFCQVISFFTTRRIGRSLWDHVGGHDVKVAPLKPGRIFALVIGMMASSHAQAIVIYPYEMERVVEAFPQMREQVERNKQWALPPRHQPKP